MVPVKTAAPALAVALPATELTVTVLPVRRVLSIVPSPSPAPESPSALPVEPGNVAELTLLLAMTSLLSARLTSVCSPPEKAVASPTVFVALIELRAMVVLRIVAAVPPPTWTPPAIASVPSWTSLGMAAARLAWLLVTVLLLMVSVPPSTKTPPLSANRPLGAVAVARLPLMVVLLRVSEESQFWIAPACASLATEGNPAAAPTRLSLMVVLVTVSVPQLSIPPPYAPANGRRPLQAKVISGGHGGPKLTVVVGATRLSVITLFEIETVAPPLKSAFGGISMPPPIAITPAVPTNLVDSGLDRATPPVMVTPSTETVGSLDAPRVPMVSTEPPPLMIVTLGPAPTRLTLLSIVMPPAKVPCPIWITSASWSTSQ